jgi:MATE family multidrug resistance protein
MHSNRREFSTIARLAAPVVATQLGTMMLGVVDNVMLGNLSVEALNASSLGRLWVMGTWLFGMGLVFGIDPFVSQAHGAGDGKAAGLALQRGLLVGLLASVPIGLLWVFTEEALVLFGQDPLLAREAERYALVQLPGLPFLLCFHALRQYLQGRGIVRPAMWVAILANGLNYGLNWLLIFGNLGFPKLGVMGAGIATAATQVAMFGLLVLLVVRFRLAEGAWTPWGRESWAPRGLWRVTAVGAPVAFQIGLEMWAFQIVTLWAGRLGAPELAAHTIVLNLASVSFMIPLGISIGTSTRVGNLLGAGEPREAQHASFVAFAMGAGAMALCALVFLLGRNTLPLLYVGGTADNSEVLAIAARVLPIAAAFQLFDGLQVVGSGILRGMGRTLPGALINLVGYYVLALPFAAWLSFSLDQGLTGLWWGLSLGLSTIALALVGWVAVRGPGTVRQRIQG